MGRQVPEAGDSYVIPAGVYARRQDTWRQVIENKWYFYILDKTKPLAAPAPCGEPTGPNRVGSC